MFLFRGESTAVSLSVVQYCALVVRTGAPRIWLACGLIVISIIVDNLQWIQDSGYLRMASFRKPQLLATALLVKLRTSTTAHSICCKE